MICPGCGTGNSIHSDRCGTFSIMRDEAQKVSRHAIIFWMASRLVTVRVRYLRPALTLMGARRLDLGARLTVPLRIRMRPEWNEHWSEWLWNEAGSCIDAPDWMPAGACQSDDCGPMQITISRDG